MKKPILIVLLAILTVLVVSYFIFDEPLPKGESGPAADELAQKMLNAVNDDAWQNTVAV